MPHLPARIAAHLCDIDGQPFRAANLLVGINLLVDGRYYYGNVLGLTDKSGVVAIPREELELRFASDKANYPMDYRVDIDDCDPMIELVVFSGAEIDEASQAVAANANVSADIRDMYTRAQNSAFTPALLRVWAELPYAKLLTANLTISPHES